MSLPGVFVFCNSEIDEYIPTRRAIAYEDKSLAYDDRSLDQIWFMYIN